MKPPPFLVVSTLSSVVKDCIIWRQDSPTNTLYIYEATQELLTLFPDIAVEKVLSIDFDSEYRGPLYPYCYTLPLLPGQVQAHREYCLRAMNEQRMQTEKACRAFGMLAIHKWIQTTQEQSWVLYYQLMTEPAEACRQKFLLLQNDAQALLATKTLREQTGCAFAELCPHTLLQFFS